MNRRRLLAGLTGVGVVGVGWGVSSDALSTDALSTGQASDANTVDERVETVDAPGSTSGEQPIPADGPLLIDFMSVTCSVCSDSMPALVETYEQYGESVSFLSVSTDAVGFSVDESTLADWWADHDGQWSLGVDPQLSVTQAMAVSAVPTTVLVDERGRLVDRLRGEKTTAELAAMIEPVDGV